MSPQEQWPTNEAYHADCSHLTSSQLKLVLEDPAAFKRQYIDGVREEVKKAYFDEGSYVHSLILEPHKVAEQYAFFEGFRKAGHEWQGFLKGNQGRTILSAPQKFRSEKLFSAFNKRPEAAAMLEGSKTEHIGTATHMDLAVKARADIVNFERSFVADVKTTSEPTGPDFFKMTIDMYAYDLSAAHYLNVFGPEFSYYWIVLSKADDMCSIYKASKETLMKGRLKLTRAMDAYKQCMASGVWAKQSPGDNFCHSAQGSYEIVEV